MHPILICLSHVLRPLTHPSIPHTVIVPCYEDILASGVMYFRCRLHHFGGLVPVRGGGGGGIEPHGILSVIKALECLHLDII